MEADTLTAAMERLRGGGYTLDFEATAEGLLVCRACDLVEDPASMQIDHQIRFEGESDPGDETILLAFTCTCGEKGLYSAAFGPDTPPEDVAVLQRLAAREQAERAADV